MTVNILAPPLSLGPSNGCVGTSGITADLCSARELIAPARAKSGLLSLKDVVKSVAEKLKKTR